MKAYAEMMPTLGNSMLERLFRLREHGTTAKTEILAGLTTFLTMSYIVFVNPSILSSPGTGMPFSGVLTATVLVAFSMTLLMGLYAKLPFDTLRDFAPITIIHNNIFAVCVNPSVPARNVAELIALAKKTGKVSYSSPGAGVAHAGLTGVQWSGLNKTLIAIVLSPTLGMMLAMLIMLITSWLGIRATAAGAERLFRVLHLDFL